MSIASAKIARATLVATALLCLASCVQQPTDAAEPEPGPPLGVAAQAVVSTQSVKVTNSDAEAVPTKAVGTTNVAGGVAATQSGPWTVGISGTPTVNAQQGGAWDVNVSGDVSLAPGSNVVAEQGGPWSVSVAGTPNVSLVPGTTVGVSGAVSIAGTPTVNVGSMPPVNVGAVTLSGTSTVEVTNAPSNPVIVRSGDEPARQPFAKRFFVELGPGVGSGGQQIVVPAGKRLVIDFVSADVVTGEGETAQVKLLAYNADGLDFTYYAFPMTRLGPAFLGYPSYDRLQVAQQARVYGFAGKQVQFGAYREIGTSDGTFATTAEFNISASGYFIDL